MQKWKFQGIKLLLVVVFVLAARAGTVEAANKPRLAILPITPAAGQAYDARGMAVHELLQQVVLLHAGLEDFCFLWKFREVFPEEGEFLAYLRGEGPELDLAAWSENLEIRYWLSGTWLEADGDLQVVLRLFDAEKGEAAAGREMKLALDDGLVEFRRSFLDWLAAVGLSMQQDQVEKALWREAMDMAGFRLLGEAVVEHWAVEYRGRDKTDISLYAAAAENSPESYFCHNLLGWGQYGMKKYDKAIESFRKAIALNANGLDAAGGLKQIAWSVADNSTGQFMRNFYRLRQEENLSKAEALRRALRPSILLGPVYFDGALVVKQVKIGYGGIIQDLYSLWCLRR